MVWKLDRAFRSSLHALRTMEDMDGLGVGFEVLTQAIDTTISTGRLTFAVLSAVAEMERSLIRDRVLEGMQLPCRKGKAIGRPRVMGRPGFAASWELVAAELAAGRLSQRQAARRLRVGQATVARLLRAAPEGEASSDDPGRDRDWPRTGCAKRWSFPRRCVGFPGGGS